MPTAEADVRPQQARPRPQVRVNEARIAAPAPPTDLTPSAALRLAREGPRSQQPPPDDSSTDTDTSASTDTSTDTSASTDTSTDTS